MLWANHTWWKQQQSRGQTNESDEDDTEQFGIQEGVGDGDGGEQVPVDDEDEEEVLPLYGEADSDFGDSNSEVISTVQLALQNLWSCHWEMLCKYTDTAAFHMYTYMCKDLNGMCVPLHVHGSVVCIHLHVHASVICIHLHVHASVICIHLHVHASVNTPGLLSEITSSHASHDRGVSWPLCVFCHFI